MAKKLVRGITDVKTINNQDFDTNNVNDLLSDGQYNYIHRKKGKTEEYHNLTDNIKTISSDNTDLLTVTNNNKTTNTATLHPKHDAQKEQVIESTRNTIAIHHGENGTAEKTTVDTNPQKVLEHENLTVGDGLIKEHSGNTTNIRISRTKVLFNDSLTAGTGITVFHDASWWGPKVSLSKEFIDTVNGKQNALTGMNGISITGDSISLTAIDNYSEDLNNLTYTCTAKPIDNTPNLPTGVGGNGVLSVIRVGNVVSQTYHALDNNVYYRITNNSSTTFVWTPWVKVTTTAV